jgi:predicted nucleic acid-binding protein
MKVVCNSSPLIHLSAMGQLNLLKELFLEVLIPEEVYEEVVIHGKEQPGSVDVRTAAWIVSSHVSNRTALRTLQATLGSGEAACIVFADSIDADLVILDDKLARLHAQTQGLKVTGTVGVLLKSDERCGLDFRVALQELLATGFRLSPREARKIMALWQHLINDNYF